MTLSTPTNKEKYKNIHNALTYWHGNHTIHEKLSSQYILIQNELPPSGQWQGESKARLATNKVLRRALDELQNQKSTLAKILLQRFLDKETITAIAHRRFVSEHTVSREQRTAIENLAKIIWTWEIEQRNQQAEDTIASLPLPTYSKLFGFDDIQQQILTQLKQESSPWILLIVGMGGIGKTALAHTITCTLIRAFHFPSVIWIRADPPTKMNGKTISPKTTYKHILSQLATHLNLSTQTTTEQLFNQVRQYLKKEKHLIVIDNLEEEEDTAYLLNHLSILSNPTKFLLTTRTHAPKEAIALNFPLAELSESDSITLIKHHAHEVGLSSLLQSATTNDIQTIYKCTGGNPLALKLVISLLDTLPLGKILTGLQKGTAHQVEKLYRRIYLKTWQILSEQAKDLLQAMPLISGTGASPEQLQEISELSEGQLWQAIQELRHRSLLEIRGTIHERRYGIHRLTETFLLTDIIKLFEQNI